MTSNNTDEQIRHAFDEWHRAVKDQDAGGMAALYAHDGVLETPARASPVARAGGRRRARQRRHREVLRAKLPGRSGEGVFEDWFRSGQYFTDGQLLIWEYPRETPKGDQTDVIESMDLENGQITHHRVYWGWVGFSKLHNAINKARP
jgi:ketosteroid isomerase-like protein